MTSAIPDEAAIRERLRGVMDPEAGFNIVDLGLVYRIAIEAPRVIVEMTMTCPAASRWRARAAWQTPSPCWCSSW